MCIWEITRATVKLVSFERKSISFLNGCLRGGQKLLAQDIITSSVFQTALSVVMRQEQNRFIQKKYEHCTTTEPGRTWLMFESNPSESI